MKCIYQTDVTCRYDKAPDHMKGHILNTDCKDCELSDNYVRPTGGCLAATAKIAIFILLLLISTISAAQATKYYNTTHKNNSIYAVFQPMDLGLGIRYDYNNQPLGFYASISHGNYWLNESHTQYIKNHNKYTLGLGLRLPRRLHDVHTLTINAGINYHDMGEVKTYEIPRFNDKILNPWSFELGCAVKFNKFAMAVRTDILRWEPCFDFGWSF